MPLFNVSVLSTLNMPREVRELLRTIADSQAQVAVTLAALLAKLNEEPPVPDGYVLESEVQAQLNTFAAHLRDRNVSTAAEVQRIFAEQFPDQQPGG